MSVSVHLQRKKIEAGFQSSYWIAGELLMMPLPDVVE